MVAAVLFCSCTTQARTALGENGCSCWRCALFGHNGLGLPLRLLHGGHSNWGSLERLDSLFWFKREATRREPDQSSSTCERSLRLSRPDRVAAVGNDLRVSV